jgi:hypothetical protein
MIRQVACSDDTPTRAAWWQSGDSGKVAQDLKGGTMTEYAIPGASMAGIHHQWIHSGFVTPLATGSNLYVGTARKGAWAGLLLPLILMLLWNIGGCAAVSTDADTAPPGEAALNGRFRTLAFEQLSFKLEKSSPLPPDAQRAIEEFIAAGARRLSADGATPERIATAEDNLNRFITGLSEAADVGELGDISAETVAATGKRLCPLYPFC